jgi:hypothetical protein
MERARYKRMDMSPRLLPIDLEAQMVPGTFAHAPHHLIDELDLSAFDARYRDKVAAAYAGYAADSFRTRRLRELCSATHKSYCICCASQLSADVENALERRIAISGLIPARPFNMADSVFRLTPSASEASVIVKPRGSKQSSFRTSPG